jgi:hypothetical protein
MTQNNCNICNKSFNNEQELREHQRNTHDAGNKQQDNPSNQENRGERKIAS